jgi:4-diphosphocytidyl-2C-methyl-D-erythritol kinase
VLRTPSGQIAGYLNATPRQGAESLRDWAAFRVAHNREEGDREVRLLAKGTDLHLLSGAGSCVIDSYRTESSHRYREVACIVSGRSATTVIVGAAPPLRWAAEAPAIQQAIDSFKT